MKIINEEISNRELINKNTNAFQSEIAELKETLKVLNNDYKKEIDNKIELLIKNKQDEHRSKLCNS